MTTMMLRSLLLPALLMMVLSLSLSLSLLLCSAALPTTNSTTATTTTPTTPTHLQATATQQQQHSRSNLALSSQEDVQPKAIVTVESRPARKVFGSLSFPHGSPFCQGMPTFWLVGHENRGERPHCLVNSDDDYFDGSSDFDFAGSQWKESETVELSIGGDRHDCTALDVNNDGLLDVLCGVGANKGKTAKNKNEVFLTTPSGVGVGVDPSPSPSTGAVTSYTLQEVVGEHGLEKYPSMRNRLMVSLKAADGGSLVFLATHGSRRDDGLPNQHRMFRLTHPPIDNSTSGNSSSLGFFFEEVMDGPWVQHTRVSAVQVADIDGNGLDDLVVCNQRSQRAMFFLQGTDGTWTEPALEGRRAKGWRNVRVADVTGDGIIDLVVVGWGATTTSDPDDSSYVRVFKGKDEYPYFNFKRQPYFELLTAHATPDVEVLDVNNDGHLDLYVVQVDERPDSAYCGGKFNRRDWWPKGNQPPASFVPPLDEAHDLLLLGTGRNSEEKFEPVQMAHSKPGCGFFLEKWNNQTMILGQGNHNHPGHNLLLQW